MKKKSIAVWLVFAWLGLMLVLVGGATYAWFTFHPYTNVEPISSTISDGEVALMIASNKEDEFKTQCTLPKSVNGDMRPITTPDLVHFYTDTKQNRQGITMNYQNAVNRVESDTIHGMLYLKSLKDDCEVYFYRSGMYFGDDPQLLAALRLGLRIKVGGTEKSYIFSLDDMLNTQTAQSLQTTEQEKVVVGSISDQGRPNYVADPAKNLRAFFAVPSEDAHGVPKVGAQALCTIQAGEIASVEYWLYLEGCDENCTNDVQDRETSLQLSFAGVTAP